MASRMFRSRLAQGDDSDEEDLCLSNKWTFQRTSRRWSRVDDPHTPLPGADGNGSPGAPEMTDAAIGQGVLSDRRTDTPSARGAQGRLEGEGRASGQAISTPVSQRREPESFKARSQESFKARSQESFKAMSQESFKARSQESFKARSQESFKAMSQESFKARSQESFKATSQESFKATSQESFKARSQESFKALSQESFKARSQESFKAMLRELESFKATMQQQEPESFKAKSQESVKATPRPQVPNGHAHASPRGTGRPGATSKRGGVYLEDLDVLAGAPGGRRGFRSQEDLLFLVPEDHTPGTFPKALSVESLSPAGGDGAGWRTAGNGEDPPPRAPRAGSRVSVYDNVPGSHLYASTGDLLDLERDGLLPGVGPILPPGTPPPQGPSPPSPSPPDGRRAASPTGPSGRPSCLGPRPSPPPPPAARSVRGHTAAQLSLLRRLSLLRLTAIMERCSAGARGGRTWSVPKFMKRTRVPDPSAQGVFGVPLLVHVRRTGHPLPPGIQEALGHLRRSCLDQVGLFRRPGVRSRIHALRRAMEESEGVPGRARPPPRACPPRVCPPEDQSAYDVADLVKLFFRDLPEPLFTNKLRDSFLRVYRYVPEAQRLQAARAAVLLLPDEHREALHALLLLLADVGASARLNRMTPASLALCLAPSLFHLRAPPVVQKKHAAGKPDPRDLSENMAAVQGLAHMITECDQLFEVPQEMVAGSLTSYLEAEIHPPGLAEGGAALQASLERLVRGLQKEAKERAGGWVTCSSPDEVDLAFKKVGFGPPLRLWRAAVEVTAPPSAVLRLLRERPAWGGDPARLEVLQSLDAHTEVIQFELGAMAPLPPTDFVVLRTWRTDLPKGACALVSLSVEHGDARPTAGVRAAVTESQYLIEPCGSGKSRLTHECRIDLRGRSPEWYSRAFGHLLASALAGVRDSFLPLLAEGPETKI